MAGLGQDKRLEALEAETPERPTMAVLRAEWGGEAEVLEAYYRDTPEDQWAGLVVVVVGFN